MKISMKLFIWLLFLVSFQSFAKTGFMNMMEAFEKTNQGRKVKARIEKESKKAESNLKALEDKLKKEEADLKQEAALLSERGRAEKISKFQEKVFNFQKNAKNKETELQKLQAQLMEPVLNRLKSVTGEIAAGENYTVIKNMGADTLWVAPGLDITSRVYKAYNKKYK